ncbi:MAG: tRNA uridine-5-carboxymethylaminomethyl(34) synthesis GTPase MnmE [Ignavibacteria bacterium]|jgi:tRNA modification GTPase
MHFNSDTTICSLITPPGLSGIAMIRLSGPQAFSIIDKHLHTSISEKESHTISYAVFQDHESPIDTVTIFKYVGPHSYTGQDIIEIGCHGGYIVPKRIIELLISSGAILAEPGEFTLRAFLNGKLDLTQAEAVNDIIHLQSPAALESASKQLIGSFSKELSALRDATERLFKYLILDFDFSQEDIELVPKERLISELQALSSTAKRFIESFETAKTLRSGHQVLLLGYPNAGKSSLFNAMLGYARSIVSDVPGTTRDFVEGSMIIDGIHFTLIDTAGIHEHTSDAIEIKGIAYSLSLIKRATIILIINDITCGLNHSQSLMDLIIKEHPKAQRILVHNKCDIHDIGIPESDALFISAKQSHGLETIVDALSTTAKQTDTHIAFLLNERQAHLLQDYIHAIEQALQLTQQGMSTDVLAIELRSALDTVGLILGTIYTEDLLNDVFANFCIGK